ncbi:tRNA (adenosine(37)-N6)-threonylcarbamoyltransferase complex ATPase subunit type 1 TsaE [Microbulbifer hydrolyticus]|uniref:tRNA threonylcarbamoyladenosine biosynthesis protein TsaE n=1 Tax=Microbulbifer hydrolyticus TaxID=48074 RepID=A0A6P1T8E5_9GAMM|nr:tRNA (adenosine(37)-N6)-threonylcarbamoyltransferase complex ATPase subunit type 1 TsaE [Microbulbifer hydrolyticus]MBB5211429.1 tRNA threonylcarbamoyladenosine biosynthesis protein TsaE [Microbulbifer hydrolyticus]QHQ37816.1 tRNA (adenosine(37)-N6)-threonylcarbamoyltransferase complex ATPase subunit type 1 TsaE [Microbulbifer hydrolyticus]
MNALPVEKTLYLADEAATVAAGEALGKACNERGMGEGLVIFLGGQLGAGKTTFSRGVLRAFGHRGAVKSPTYTLVEPYEFAPGTERERRVYHFDLYRLGDAEELEYMGVRDYFGPGSLSLVEWSERGAGVLPEPDIELALVLQGEGRELKLVALTQAGARALEQAQFSQV